MRGIGVDADHDHPFSRSFVGSEIPTTQRRADGSVRNVSPAFTTPKNRKPSLRFIELQATVIPAYAPGGFPPRMSRCRNASALCRASSAFRVRRRERSGAPGHHALQLRRPILATGAGDLRSVRAMDREPSADRNRRRPSARLPLAIKLEEPAERRPDEGIHLRETSRLQDEVHGPCRARSSGRSRSTASTWTASSSRQTRWC